MSLLFRVIYAAHCRSTHHKLAMDALPLMECPGADRWRNLVLKHHDAYLLGAKAPDTRFRDFQNHVLHVEQDYWGGAAEAARLWYQRALETLRKEHWVNGIYAAGVLSHYYTDPIQPFHTGQSPAENNIHRAAEWSITQSYAKLWQAAIEGGLPAVALPHGPDWLERMVKQGADRSHRHYQTLIEHYNFDLGHKNPNAGWDDASRKILSELLGYAAAGFARILDRLFQDTQISPPKVISSVPTFLAAIAIPLQFLSKKVMDSRDRAQVQAMYRELQDTGVVEENLPEDVRAVRDLFLADFPESARSKSLLKTGHSKPNPSDSSDREQESEVRRYFLELQSPVEEAPSIGPKTARRLERVKILTVKDLLEADPKRAASQLNVPHITPEVIRDWQDQARLVCSVPGLRGQDAQILVASGYRDPWDISTAPTEDLLMAAALFAESREGQRVVRSGKLPDEAEVRAWQASATEARDVKAA